MAINLVKGQKIDLTKGNPALKKVIIGLGWDTNKYSGGFDFDLDASVFLVGSNGRTNHDEDFIFYNNLKSRNEAVIHTGDNRTGEGDGDDEQILLEFAKMPADVEKMAVTVTIHEAIERGQNFGQVSNAYVRVINKDTGEDVLRYDLGEDFSIETAIVVCEIYRNGADWKFSAVGSGFQGGLAALCKNYGLDV
ncbi:TerD family protein [Cellulosilyticum sp. ST5]|uniref:Stress protein n=1 Tax=Cellulosilyticum lentocellum (strain ATCC 49066 / DSM 5427 / NCIMB 11756 / RHM5) TaxID=642492 RepID=F2JGK2_CELLD|nr:TerD family protein [Cellulosilyticum lentocellum]ADZ82957.1 stress protein [Cellulosilyticum lentocellum DSM 5427]